MKALRINIYKHNGSDCSNGGISSRHNEILLLCDDGYIDVDGTEETLCKVVTRNIMGEEYKHVEPVNGKYGAGFMAGGCYVGSCDSRFGRISEYPLALHDRCETWEQYEMLSH